MTFTTIKCAFCGAKYEIPESVRATIESKEVSCVECPESWVAIRSSGLLSKVFDRGHKLSPVDLGPFRKREPDPFAQPLSGMFGESEMAIGRTVTVDLAGEKSAGGADSVGTVLDLGGAGAAAASSSAPLEGMRAGFAGLEGPFEGRGFRVQKSPTVIGRTSGDMIVPDERVSSKHAQLDVLGMGQFSLKDLASTNGTLVNDRPISTTALRNGDIVSFGGVRFQFLVRAERKGASAP